MAKVYIKADGKYPVDRKRIRAKVLSVLAEKRITGEAQVSVMVVGDRKMKFLNDRTGKFEIIDIKYLRYVFYKNQYVFYNNPNEFLITCI